MISKYNEIDIYATKLSKRKGFKGSNLGLYEDLVIECKKQEVKPWVFFEKGVPNLDPTTLSVIPIDISVPFENHFQDHYYFNKKPCSYHFPAFVSSGKPDVILDAINHVLDALDYIRMMITNIINKYKIKMERIFYPVIVLDGKLFSARIEENENVVATETDYLQLRVDRALKEPIITNMTNKAVQWEFSRTYIIDVVRKNYLGDFLKNFP